MIEKLSNVLIEDLSDIACDASIPWGRLHGCTALVTGATGQIGGLILRALSAAGKKHGLGLRLLAHGRNAIKGKALTEACGAEFICGDIRRPPLLAAEAGRIDYIVHCSAMTKSADMLSKPADVIATEVEGTKNALELAREKSCEGLLYLSSMEAYGQTGLKEVKEGDLGCLDITSPRNSYPQSKRMCETMCAAYAAQHKLPIKIARLARVIGPGLPNDPDDMRVAAQFARKALAGEDIELHTAGASMANCCYAADAVRGMLTILLKGKAGEAYNVSNPRACVTIRQMAEVVAQKVCGGRIKVKIDVPEDVEKRGYASDVGYVINADKLMGLGWSPKFGLEEMFGRMVEEWGGGRLCP